MASEIISFGCLPGTHVRSNVRYYSNHHIDKIYANMAKNKKQESVFAAVYSNNKMIDRRHKFPILSSGKIII
jgi:hypothetical protein